MSEKPRLLDLFCGAGGAAMGYSRAGFDVTGVDVAPQPNYPFRHGFRRADVMNRAEVTDRFLRSFDVIHASPPCQAHSVMTKRSGKQGEHPDYIGFLRLRLQALGIPYVIENVPGAPLISPVRLCGSSFGLPLRRHRLFESSLPISGLPCAHDSLPKNIRIMNRGWKMTQFVPVYGSGGCKARELWPIAMGITWMTTSEMAEAIPPAYTEFIGHQLLRAIAQAA